MTHRKTMKYPIGIQTFETIRTENYCYADKTGYIHHLVESGAKQVFLSRPRRFGKSLFVSTLEAYFQGRKELFEGLEISKYETEWESYPVLRFDFGGLGATNTEVLISDINTMLLDYEKKYGVDCNDSIPSVGTRFGTLIKNVAEKTGKKVVVLIDEYDKGIVEVLQHEKKLENNIDLLRPFFSQMKVQDQYLRFVFLTGVSRFRNLTLFSSPNQLDDISLNVKYAAICGITQEELYDVFDQSIKELADTEDVSTEEAKYQLKVKYDSYRFTKKDVHVYNPFSILKCFSELDLGNYWLTSGGSSKVFIDYLKKSKYELAEIEQRWVSGETLGGAYCLANPIPLLFQTGYLTIVDYKDGLYRLGIPNGEVRTALLEELVPYYMGIDADDARYLAIQIGKLAKEGDVDGLVRQFQSIMGEAAYQNFNFNDVENVYNMTLWLICRMAGVTVRNEAAVAGGSIDMVIETPKFVYVMEFKKDKSARAALDQINSKGYALPWAANGRQVFKIGVNFSSETRNISDWVVECLAAELQAKSQEAKVKRPLTPKWGHSRDDCHIEM